MTKRRKLEIYDQYIKRAQQNIDDLSERIKKGKSMGAEDPSHKHHSFLQKLKRDMEKQKENKNHYVGAWESLAEVEYETIDQFAMKIFDVDS